jgi:hypothetical protein
MPDHRHPRIASAILLALFWGTGYLVGSSAQRGQAPDRVAASTQGLANGAAAHVVTFDPKSDSALPLEYYVGFPPSCVLVHGGSDYAANRSGVLILPQNVAVGVYATSNVNHSLVTAVVPIPTSAEFLLASKDGIY